MTIYYLPLEEIESRYTVLMNWSIEKYINCISLYPREKRYEIEAGEFLDINRTINYKAQQISMVSELFAQGEIKDGDIFLIGDIFFPGIESIKYMAELQNINVKLFAFNYAGRSDPDDFVQNLGRWSDTSELSYHQVCDGIFSGSEYHTDNIIKYFNLPSQKVYTTGLIWDTDWVKNVHKPGTYKKEDFIIYPHRLCKEKGLDEFLQFAQATDKKIVVTTNAKKRDLPGLENVEYIKCNTKKEYYALLDKASHYLSTAYQETWGYTLHEAIFYRCQVIVPDRACYREMIPEKCLYRTPSEIPGKLKENLHVPMKWSDIYNKNAKEINEIIRCW